eukprot:INCI7211.1.p1 GENE.INCI7211.1~~INCI7211.1.p1  ORF type:complete len:270 (+),score=56.04 INCI7211.1:553-1362(+)
MDAEAIFRMLDTDGNGTVTKEEFVAQWKSLQQKLSPEHASPALTGRNRMSSNTRRGDIAGGEDSDDDDVRVGAARAAAAAAATAVDPASKSISVTPPVQPRRPQTTPAARRYSYASAADADSSQLDPLFFESFDLSNDEDVVFSPAKPEKYTRLNYNWSIAPGNRATEAEESTATRGPPGGGQKSASPAYHGRMANTGDENRMRLISTLQSKQRESGHKLRSPKVFAADALGRRALPPPPSSDDDEEDEDVERTDGDEEASSDSEPQEF